MRADMVGSIELKAASDVPEWKKEICIMVEQDGGFDGQTFRHLDGRQQSIHRIPRQRSGDA